MGGGIYLFCGEEDFLKEEASKRMISKLLPSESQKLDCDIYSAKDNYRDIFDTLNTLPLLFDKRIVVINDIETLPEPKKKSFLAYLKQPHKHICLIIKSSRTTSGNKFVKEISHYAKTYLFKRLGRRELKDWIYKRLSQHKKNITRDALDTLLELKGSGNLAILSGELEKLVTYKGEDKTIRQEDIIELVGKSATKRAFDLIEAVSFKDRNAALLLVHELTSKGKREIPEVMGLMGWQLRRIWKAKTLLARKKDKHSVAHELNIRSFSLDRFLSQVNSFNVDELKRDFKLLIEADRSIKSGRNRPEFVLEQLVMKLCSG